MKRIPWMTPHEHRLAILLLVLALLGAVGKNLKGLDPEVEAWLREPMTQGEGFSDPKSAGVTLRRSPYTPPSLDPNQATESELIDLPGVGPALAKRMVEHRPYRTLDDLLRVPGIGKITLQKIRPRLAFHDSTKVGVSPQTPARPSSLGDTAHH